MIAKELAERFFVIGDPVFFHQGDEIGRGIAGESGFGEVRIFREKVFRLAIKIREIAAASARDEDFFANFVGAFQNDDAAAAFAGFDSAEEAGGPAPQNHHVEIGHAIKPPLCPCLNSGADTAQQRVYTACTNTLLQGACEERRKDGKMFIARIVAVV